ncbi:hypothetical protein CYMTET_27608, partial [Cymbomonas tetramitiformis]
TPSSFMKGSIQRLPAAGPKITYWNYGKAHWPFVHLDMVFQMLQSADLEGLSSEELAVDVLMEPVPEIPMQRFPLGVPTPPMASMEEESTLPMASMEEESTLPMASMEEESTLPMASMEEESTLPHSNFAPSATSKCWPSSAECPPPNVTRQGDAAMRRALLSTGELHGGSVIVSVLHELEQEVFDAWSTVMLSHLPHVLHSWVVVTTSHEARRMCVARLKAAACVKDPTANLLRWRLIEVMEIALRLNLTVTGSNFHVMWLRDARLYFHPQADFQMAIKSPERQLECRVERTQPGDHCHLGATAEGIYHLRASSRTAGFVSAWLHEGFVQMRRSGTLSGKQPSRTCGRLLNQDGPLITWKGLLYAHMDHRYLPGDAQLAKRVASNGSHCRLAVYVFPDGASSIHKITAELRHTANIFKKIPPKGSTHLGGRTEPTGTGRRHRDFAFQGELCRAR